MTPHLRPHPLRHLSPGHAMSTATIKAHLATMFAGDDTAPDPHQPGPDSSGPAADR